MTQPAPRVTWTLSEDHAVGAAAGNRRPTRGVRGPACTRACSRARPCAAVARRRRAVPPADSLQHRCRCRRCPLSLASRASTRVLAALLRVCATDVCMVLVTCVCVWCDCGVGSVGSGGDGGGASVHRVRRRGAEQAPGEGPHRVVCEEENQRQHEEAEPPAAPGAATCVCGLRDRPPHVSRCGLCAVAISCICVFLSVCGCGGAYVLVRRALARVRLWEREESGCVRRVREESVNDPAALR
jgi:hypothetical protein